MSPWPAWWRDGAGSPLLLRNLGWHSEGEDGDGDVRIGRGRILERGRGLVGRRGERVVDAAGHVALPGLINAHDHLGLNLFPPLGRPPYANFYAWARDIYHPDRPPLSEVLRVPLGDRLRWGAYKNLIGGVTTVVHHDPYEARVFERRFPVRVLREYGWAHSLGYGDGLVAAFARSRGRPFILHAAEGVDAGSSRELDELDRLGMLGPTSVLVHAVAATERQIARCSAAGTSVVWCPASNLRLYGRTAPVPAMRGRVRLALGTDSTLSGSPTLLHELGVARGTGLATAAEILEMVTTAPAAAFRLTDGRGTLRDGAPADLLLLPRRGESPADALVGATPADVALVLAAGRPRLADPLRAEALDLGPPTVLVEGAPKWIDGDIGALKGRIIGAAGPAALAGNTLWSSIEPIPGSPAKRRVARAEASGHTWERAR